MLQHLGQSGLRLETCGVVVYLDPYLSDRVAELYGDDLRRLKPPPIAPGDVRDADWVLISHLHEDHCDPATILPLAEASPQARFLGPRKVLDFLAEQGLAEQRLVLAEERWVDLGGGLAAHGVPAAHPELERDEDGASACVGYVLQLGEDGRIYHSGDTSAHDEVIAAAKALGPLEIAFLPVNERNYFRERRGIIGNMSVREAFGMAEALGVRTLVPIHWDLFEPNSVFPEEILLLHRLLEPPFRLVLDPADL